MKRKLRLKGWVKNTLAVILLNMIIVGGIILINARFERIENCMNEGNSRDYCSVPGR